MLAAALVVGVESRSWRRDVHLTVALGHLASVEIGWWRLMNDAVRRVDHQIAVCRRVGSCIAGIVECRRRRRLRVRLRVMRGGRLAAGRGQ